MKRWRLRSAESIYDELQYLYTQGARRFFFCDDNSIADRETGIANILKLCHLIIRDNLEINFRALIRPDTLLPTDYEVLEVMRHAGLCMLLIGLEASNKKQLQLYGKPYDLDMMKEIIAMTYEHQIAISIGYIMFCPYSTFEMLKQNIQFLTETRLTHNLNVYFNALVGFSEIAIEKMLSKDELVIRPTTYKLHGLYKFENPRIAALYECLKALYFEQEFETYCLLLNAGCVASTQAKKGNNAFAMYMQSAEKIGNASADLFAFCLKHYESGRDETEISPLIYEYSKKWRNIIEQEKRNLERFVM